MRKIKESDNHITGNGGLIRKIFFMVLTQSVAINVVSSDMQIKGTDGNQEILITEKSVAASHSGDVADKYMEEGYTLTWSDEFEKDGVPDSETWGFEHGFVRNNELQWYQRDNAECKDGFLVITGRTEKVANPGFSSAGKDWRSSRESASYTSSSVNTSGKKEFLYGRFEIRARIPVATGAWPAIWTLGADLEWPSNGEIDLLEFYLVNGQPSILANLAWGTEQRWNAKWNTIITPYSEFTENDPQWHTRFHVWRMDWDEKFIRIYLDDRLLNETNLDQTFNGSIGDFKNPFRQPHYLLLNLAIGSNGGIPDESSFPLVYEIDYVRVYQKTNSK